MGVRQPDEGRDQSYSVGWRLQVQGSNPKVGPNPEKVQGQVREILTNGLQDIIE